MTHNRPDITQYDTYHTVCIPGILYLYRESLLKIYIIFVTIPVVFIHFYQLLMSLVVSLVVPLYKGTHFTVFFTSY